mmetsp:Transcript_3267/g.6521  ORF Transcript_3267/g.6521 Transcript_3267/m.6521 type:complete len:150 (-) Transcript_3267:88-537(-)
MKMMEADGGAWGIRSMIRDFSGPTATQGGEWLQRGMEGKKYLACIRALFVKAGFGVDRAEALASNSGRHTMIEICLGIDAPSTVQQECGSHNDAILKSLDVEAEERDVFLANVARSSTPGIYGARSRAYRHVAVREQILATARAYIAKV